MGISTRLLYRNRLLGNNMDYYFSAKENAFYPISMENNYINAGTFPDDVVLVENAVFETFSQLPPDGKERGVVHGMPEWIDLTINQNEVLQRMERQKKELINEASEMINPMLDAKNGGYIENDDIARLDKWQRYRYELTKIDTSLLNIEWPEKPQ